MPMPETPDLRQLLVNAARQVHPKPTLAQAEAGNHRMGHVRLHGLDITIEVAKGQIRSKVGTDGKVFRRKMNNHYGYLRGAVASDDDNVDVYLGDKPDADTVYVVDQVKKNGDWDEPKVMMAFGSEESAREAYLSHYPKGWTGLGAITPLSIERFKKWLGEGGAKQPVSAQPLRKAARVTGLPINRLGGLVYGLGGIDGRATWNDFFC